MQSKRARTRCYIVAALVKAIGRALDAAGCDGQGLLRDVGFDLEHLDAPTTRCPIVHASRLWERAVAATGDPAFGLKVASHIRHTTFHALSFGVAASSTLKEAFERVQRYSQLATDAVAYEFYKRDDTYHFLIELTTEVPFEAIDTLVGCQLRMCRSLIGREFSPLCIELRRPPPRKMEDFDRLLRAPLRFDAPQDRMVFDAASIERRLEEGNPELARHNDLIALQYLVRIERDDIQARVRDVLMRRMEGCEPPQEQIAEQLCMSARTLQRKLGESGTTYKEILDETRHALALAYLSTPQNSVNDVAYFLGFSSSSCFTRAFRRWTGQAPSTWRRGAMRLGTVRLGAMPGTAPRPAEPGP